MDSFEFITKYDQYLNEIRLVIKPELYPQLDELAQIDPHDLVTPSAWFANENDARGMVWAMFVKRAKKVQMGESRS
jgi:hypothetical protein